MDEGTAGNGCATPSSLEQAAAVLEAALPQIKPARHGDGTDRGAKTHMDIETDSKAATGTTQKSEQMV